MGWLWQLSGTGDRTKFPSIFGRVLSNCVLTHTTSFSHSDIRLHKHRGGEDLCVAQSNYWTCSCFLINNLWHISEWPKHPIILILWLELFLFSLPKFSTSLIQYFIKSSLLLGLIQFFNILSSLSFLLFLSDQLSSLIKLFGILPGFFQW